MTVPCIVAFSFICNWQTLQNNSFWHSKQSLTVNLGQGQAVAFHRCLKSVASTSYFRHVVEIQRPVLNAPVFNNGPISCIMVSAIRQILIILVYNFRDTIINYDLRLSSCWECNIHYTGCTSTTVSRSLSDIQPPEAPWLETFAVAWITERPGIGVTSSQCDQITQIQLVLLSDQWCELPIKHSKDTETQQYFIKVTATPTVNNLCDPVKSEMQSHVPLTNPHSKDIHTHTNQHFHKNPAN